MRHGVNSLKFEDSNTYRSLAFQIQFVTTEKNNTIGNVPLKFLVPRLKSNEALWVSYVIYQDSSVSVSVIHGGQGSISILSSGIP